MGYIIKVYILERGLQRLCSLFLSYTEFSILQKCQLDPFNYIDIWQASANVCCGDACQIWTRYLTTTSVFYNGKSLKNNGREELRVGVVTPTTDLNHALVIF